jgi:hypothetical protein
VHPVTRGNTLVIINFCLLPLTVIIVMLRMYTRAFIMRSFGGDDILICIALVG